MEVVYDSRSYICCSSVSIRAKTGQCGGVPSRTVPLAAPGPCHLPLETPYTGLSSQAAVDLGSSQYETGTVECRGGRDMRLGSRNEI